jgi:hypothetical protein
MLDMGILDSLFGKKKEAKEPKELIKPCSIHPQEESIAQCHSCKGYICVACIRIEKDACIRIEKPTRTGLQRVDFFHQNCLPSAGVKLPAPLLQSILKEDPHGRRPTAKVVEVVSTSPLRVRM